MTPEKIKQVVQKYRQYIYAVDDSTIKPTEYPSDIEMHEKLHFSMFMHILWMCDKIDEMITSDTTRAEFFLQIEKSMRWLGFIQGVLWTTGIRTIDQLREDNREEL